jgi:hypothetical protein
MDKKETKTLDSQQTSKAQLDQNAPLFAGFSQYPKIKLRIDTGIANSLDLSKRKLYLESLTSDSKTNSRLALINASLTLSSKVESVAYLNEDSQLYDSVKMTRTSLRLLNDSLLLQKCGILADAAEAHEEELAEYEETPETLAAYRGVIESFNNEVSNMAALEEELSNVNQQLTKQLKETEKDFKKVDKLVNTMRESQPAFYNLYWLSRSVKPTPSSKVAAKVKVYNAATSQPVIGAILTVARIEEGKALTSGADLVKTVKIKSAGGGVDLKGLTTGGYLFTVTYAGADSVSQTVYVNEGVLTRVDVPLNMLT